MESTLRDIEAVATELHRLFPAISVDQLRPKHSADDSGLWYVRHPESTAEAQLESTSGNCPFLVESTASSSRQIAASVPQAVTIVVAALGLREAGT
jgi:hypothetical protein